MRRQRNTQQMKEQGKNPQDQTNEEETGSLTEKVFSVMIIKMIQNLGNRIQKILANEATDKGDRKSTRLNSSH